LRRETRDWTAARDARRGGWLSLPALAVQLEEGWTLQVDGHHRLVRWAEEGRTEYPLIRFRLGTWERFLLPV
jgi:hypothetical protein